MILHITSLTDWEKARESGEYSAPSLQSEGFIHCSTVKQAIDTANIFFKGQQGLVLLCIDVNELKATCRYEEPAGITGNKHNTGIANLFPHIYGPINNSAVIKVIDFPPNDDGLFELPKELMD